ncbi:MAG: hypothetical protein HZC29_00090 [Thaumarchaeota archaeon]|nr:hypothetical protein [Nitrososphaerota archaeon]
MGLSIAIAGGIACATVILVLSILFSMTSQIYEVNSARSQSSEIESALVHTDIDTDYFYAQSGSDRASLAIQNTGTEKLWNYDKFSVIVTYNASISGSPVLTSERLSYNSAQSFGGNGVSSGSTQFARPDSDITKDNWDDAAGGNNNNILYDEIDESSQSDADYSTSGAISLLDTTETWEVGLSNVVDPQSSSNHIVRYAYGKDAAGGVAIDLTVRLLQGEYSSGIAARSAQISWAELEVPPAAGIYNCSAVTVSAGKWVIDRIMSDLLDPKTLNSNEEGRICIKLSNNVHPSSTVSVMIATDLGKTETDSIAV